MSLFHPDAISNCASVPAGKPIFGFGLLPGGTCRSAIDAIAGILSACKLHTMMDVPKIVETATSEDGFKRWQLLLRSDGLYIYEEETFEKEIYWVDDDGGERDVAAHSYWAPTHVSGLFDTRERARADAFGTLRWLSNTSTNFETNG